MSSWLEEYRQTGDNLAGKMMNHRSVEKTALVNASILGKIAWTPALDVLDVGCGDGSLLALLPPVRSRTGVVPSAEEIAALERMHSGSGIQFARGLSNRLPFPDSQFDVVICNGVFLLLDAASAQESLAEFYRIARAGAVVFVGETPVPISIEERLRRLIRRSKPRSVEGLFTPRRSALVKMCAAAGFTGVTVTPSIARYRFDYLMRKS